MKRLMLIFILVFGTFILTELPAAHADETTLLSKLDQLEKNQEQILKELDDLKSELQVVKIRVSLRN